jgi:ABC-type nitrate/sulfonate/bicarbonate transport system substrate-binding protein
VLPRPCSSCHRRFSRAAATQHLRNQPAEGKPVLTPVTFVTDWKAQAEHGGFYEALAEGLYEKAGLKVSIMQGGPGVNVPQTDCRWRGGFRHGVEWVHPVEYG